VSRSRKGLDAVQALFEKELKYPHVINTVLVTNPKPYAILDTVKKINSIPTKTSTVTELLLVSHLYFKLLYI